MSFAAEVAPSTPERRRLAMLMGLGLALVVLLPILLQLRVLRPDSVLDLHVDPSRFLADISQGWTPREDLGRRTGALLAYLPVAVAFVVMRGIGLSPVLAEQAWFALIIGGAAFGMRRLFRVLWQDERPAPRTLAALLYAFNPYVLLNIGTATVLLLTYTTLPWLASELILAVRTRRARHVAFALLLTSFGSPGVNATQNVIMWLGCITLILAAIRYEQIKGGVRYVTGVVVLAAVSSMWWIGPFLASLRGGGVDAAFQTDPIEIGASQSSYGEVLRLTGLWALYFGNRGVPYIRAHHYLLSPPVVAVSLLLPLLALLGAWTLWRDRRVQGLLLIFAVAVPMAVSVYPPGSPSLTGTGYRWLYDHVFAFRGFRSNYKWVALLAFTYALLAPLAWRWAASRKKLAVLALATCSVLAVNAVPFLADLTFARGYELGSIPGYWREAGRWLDAQPGEGRVLFTPGQPFAAYDWGRPSGDIAPLILDRPVVTAKLTSSSNQEGKALVELVDKAVRDPGIPFDKLLSVLGVTHLVQRNDLDVALYDSIPDEEMRVFLASQPSLRLVRTFGALDVYEVQGLAPTTVATAQAVDLIITDGTLADALRRYQPGTLARFEQAQQVNEVVLSSKASSVWNGLEEGYGAMRAFDGEHSTAWVPNVHGGVGESLVAMFRRPQPLTSAEVHIRRNGIDAEPTLLQLSTDAASHTVSVGPDGRAVATFDGAETQLLRLVLLDSVEGAGGGGNVGITEVRLAGVPPSVVAFRNAMEEERPNYVLDFASSRNPAGVAREVGISAAGEYQLQGTAAVPADLSDDLLRRYLRLPDAVVRSSSRWRGAAYHSALRAFDGDPGTSWVPDRHGGEGEWIEVAFETPRPLERIELWGRGDGVDGEVSEIGVAVDDASPQRRVLVPDPQGRSVLTVNRTVTRLRLTILASPDGASRNVGFSEIRIPGLEAERHPEAIGTTLLVGDALLRVTPDELGGEPRTGDALAFAGVPFEFSAQHVADAGRLRVQRGEDLAEVQRLAIFSAHRSPELQPLPHQRRSSSELLTSAVPADARYLFFAETADPFWRATLAGRELRSVGKGNGYGKVWAIEGGGTARLTFDSSGRSFWPAVSICSATAGLIGFALRGRRHRRPG